MMKRSSDGSAKELPPPARCQKEECWRCARCCFTPLIHRSVPPIAVLFIWNLPLVSYLAGWSGLSLSNDDISLELCGVIRLFVGCLSLNPPPANQSLSQSNK